MRLARLLLIATLTLAACGQSPLPAPDSRLFDQWSSMPEPTAWLPEAGTCHAVLETHQRRSAYDPVDCASPHRAETAHVGRFGASAGAQPPSAGQPAHREAWSQCDAQASAYLGGPWRDRQVRIDLTLPTAEGWQAGARWYMCQIGPMDWSGNPTTAYREPVKGRFASMPALEWGCGSQPDSGDYEARPCHEPHDTEFAGWFPLELPFAAARSKYDSNDPLFHRECLKVVARFVGAPDAAKLPQKTGTSYWLPDEKDWEAGDQAVRCFLWISGGQVSRSLRGAGAGGLLPDPRH